jgi:hypothetical protein
VDRRPASWLAAGQRYFRCLLTSFVIANILTWFALKIGFSAASELIIRVFF